MNRNAQSHKAKINSLRAGLLGAVMMVIACFGAAIAFSGEQAEAPQGYSAALVQLGATNSPRVAAGNEP